jgi:hypothetical protein
MFGEILGDEISVSRQRGQGNPEEKAGERLSNPDPWNGIITIFAPSSFERNFSYAIAFPLNNNCFTFGTICIFC